eukprot:6647988-Ditylum_brightwellii.AAC.1
MEESVEHVVLQTNSSKTKYTICTMQLSVWGEEGGKYVLLEPSWIPMRDSGGLGCKRAQKYTLCKARSEICLQTHVKGGLLGAIVVAG